MAGVEGYREKGRGYKTKRSDNTEANKEKRKIKEDKVTDRRKK